MFLSMVKLCLLHSKCFMDIVRSIPWISSWILILFSNGRLRKIKSIPDLQEVQRFYDLISSRQISKGLTQNQRYSMWRSKDGRLVSWPTSNEKESKTFCDSDGFLVWTMSHRLNFW
jgi:hypothetical protein